MNNKIISLIAAMVLGLSAMAANIKTDREWYLAGEQMKVNVTVDDSQIAYAELCDANGLAASTIVGIKDGVGTGTIELPANLHSGFYALNVYTRNSSKVCNKLVAVVNTMSKSGDDDVEWVKDETTKAVADGECKFVDVVKTDIPEKEGHMIMARIKNTYDGKTYRRNQITPALSIIGMQIHYFEGKMLNDTTAVFYVHGIHGKLPLVLSAVTDTDVSLPIEMVSPFAALLPKELPHLVFHYNRSEVEARSLEMQRHQMAIAPVKRELQIGVFTDEATEEAVPLAYDPSVLGTTPDLTYNLDEYRQFFTIREVLLEYVECVRKVKSNGYTQLIVRRGEDHYNTSLATLVLIDGMPVIDVERLLSYDARRIHYINIYGGQYTFGNGVYNGILSFVTRSGQLTNYPTERNMQYLIYDFPQ
ncbi:MAG: hypothetical protein IKM78_01760 [Prevotella sp.]|nr:hypothetical protein [Prevotella sp.]